MPGEQPWAAGRGRRWGPQMDGADPPREELEERRGQGLQGTRGQPLRVLRAGSVTFPSLRLS